MLIGIPREAAPDETRVAATPASVQKIRKLGYYVVVESGAGHDSNLTDDAYVEAGARIGSAAEAWGADVVLHLLPPTPEEVALLKDGATLISLIFPARDPELVALLKTRKVTVISMDMVPRISRAQALDMLSSMTNISGYRAVIEAAQEYDSFFTGQVTAAGKVPPAKVLVVGAGVAGLAAIGTAHALGAIVRATDPRPEVAEQVKSMGAEFISPGISQERSTDGYAKATTAEYDAAAKLMYDEQCRDVDIIITTAAIPGRPAPRIITAEQVALMKPGSVIVDMAATTGGNVEGTVAGERVVTQNRVTIIGFTELARRMPTQASMLYGNNLVHLLRLMTPGKDGQLVFDLDDVIVRQMLIQRDGESMYPPPPVSVSAAPFPPTPVPHEAAAVAEPGKPSIQVENPTRHFVPMAVGIVAFLALSWFIPAQMLGHLTVFALACVIGFYVIGSVHHALHTPLMSVTNAISGIIIVGAVLQLGYRDDVVRMLATIAIILASINIFGGFAVTHRMLAMFRKGR